MIGAQEAGHLLRGVVHLVGDPPGGQVERQPLGIDAAQPLRQKIESLIPAEAAESRIPLPAHQGVRQPTELAELVEGREGTLLTSNAYMLTGGVVGALARRAEEIHEGLAPVARDAAREVFLRLVAVDEDGKDTRRRVRRTELNNLGLSEAALDTVLDAYGSFRLLSFDHDPVTRGPTVEVAHEALIRQWPRYRDWIDGQRDALLLERRLEVATREWEENERDASFLLGGGRLEQHQQWAETSGLRLTTAEREFLDHSRVSADAEKATEGQRIRRLRRLVAGFGVALKRPSM